MKKIGTKKDQLKRGAEVNKKALQLFYHRPEWMATFNEADKKLAIEFLEEAIKHSKEIRSITHTECVRLIKKNDLESYDYLSVNRDRDFDREMAARQLVRLLSYEINGRIGAMINSIHDISRSN